MNKLKIRIDYFKSICKHKSWVLYYCKICGIKWRGIKHDLSKFSHIEFSESVKYFTGVNSSIENCRKEKGYSLAWQHHKGRNDHHYQYWLDNNDGQINPIRMPYECAVEMICDYLGTGQVISIDKKKDFKYTDELKWFINKMDNANIMHKDTQKFVYLVLRNLQNIDRIPLAKDKKTLKFILKEKYLNHKSLLDIYDYSISLSDEEFELIRKSTEEKL